MSNALSLAQRDRLWTDLVRLYIHGNRKIEKDKDNNLPNYWDQINVAGTIHSR